MNSDNFFIKKLKKPIFPRFFLNRPHNNNRAFSFFPRKIDKKNVTYEKKPGPRFQGVSRMQSKCSYIFKRKR